MPLNLQLGGIWTEKTSTWRWVTLRLPSGSISERCVHGTDPGWTEGLRLYRRPSLSLSPKSPSLGTDPGWTEGLRPNTDDPRSGVECATWLGTDPGWTEGLRRYDRKNTS